MLSNGCSTPVAALSPNINVATVTPIYQQENSPTPDPPMDIDRSRNLTPPTLFHSSDPVSGQCSKLDLIPSGRPAKTQYVNTETTMVSPELFPTAAGKTYLKHPVDFIMHRVPVMALCPRCKKAVKSVVSYRTGRGTYVSMLMTCLVVFPLVWLPYCMESCKDAVHECPECGMVLGISRY